MLSALACAKINLALHVTGVREDGYHLLSSLVAFADVGDLVEVYPASELGLQISGDFASMLQGNSQENLMLKVARRLQQHAGITQGASLHLYKHLPVASGIGGGSADAATTAKLLNSLWNLGFDEAELAHLLLPLGADIPVCLTQKPVHMSGIGEIISPIAPMPALGVVLVNPLLQLSTATVFRLYDALGKWDDPLPLPTPASAVATAQGWVNFLKNCHNSLQAIAVELAPEIAEVLTVLEFQPECLLARMSGSGATCFALCATREKADKLEKNLHHRHPHWWVRSGMLQAA